MRISQRNEPGSLDPALAALPDDLFVIRALGEGLVAPGAGAGKGATASAVPAAAERWEVSADGHLWTFHLRPEGRWSNGEAVTAADFVASYRRALDPATASPKATLFFEVRNAEAFATGRLSDFSQVGFRAQDSQTLVIDLAAPSPHFLDHAAAGCWIPVNPRVVARFGRSWTRPGHYVGNGPFVLEEWRPHQRIAVRRNRFYARAARVGLERIDFVAFDDGNTEDAAFRSSEVDVTMAIPFSKIEPYERERPLEFHETLLAETRFLTFNTTHAPLDDLRVRKALSMALDRRRLARISGSLEAFRIAPPALRPEAEPGALLVEDVPEARRLLAEAGYPEGRGLRTMELSSWVRSDVLEAIQQMWRDRLHVGVALAAARDARVHIAALRSGRYDIGFITAIPDVPDSADLLRRFTTGASDNYAQWSDASYDALVAAVARERSAAGQGSAATAAERRLLGEMPVTPIYFNRKHWLMSPAVRGWFEDVVWNRSYLDLRWVRP